MHVKMIASPDPTICELAAACCTNEYAANLDRGAQQKALLGAMRSKHESVLEHASFTFYIQNVSRVLLAQLTRHRLASFSVQSQRYVHVGTGSAIIPPTVRKNPDAMAAYERHMKASFELYEWMIDLGIPQEDARYILPGAVMTDLVMTMNVRELRHFLALRMCNRAQWEIRRLADEIYKLVAQAAPVLLVGAGPGCCTRDGCPEGKRSCGRPRNKELLEMVEALKANG